MKDHASQLTINKDAVTIVIPVLIEKAPDATGRSGLLTCKHVQQQALIPSI